MTDRRHWGGGADVPLWVGAWPCSPVILWQLPVAKGPSLWAGSSGRRTRAMRPRAGSFHWSALAAPLGIVLVVAALVLVAFLAPDASASGGCGGA